MTLSELIDKLRQRVGDVEDPYLLEDTFYINAINTIGSQIYQLPVKVNTYSLNVISGQGEYSLPQDIINIYSAYSNSTIPIYSFKDLIKNVGINTLDYLNRIQQLTIIKDYKPNNTIGVFPIPTSNFTIQLLCHFGFPTYTFNQLTNQIEIQENSTIEQCLIEGVASLFYSTDDVDVFNLERYQLSKANFELLLNKIKREIIYFNYPSRINNSFIGFL